MNPINSTLHVNTSPHFLHLCNLHTQIAHPNCADYRFHLRFYNMNSHWIDNNPSILYTYGLSIQTMMKKVIVWHPSFIIMKHPCLLCQMESRLDIGVCNHKTAANNWVFHTIYHLKAHTIFNVNVWDNRCNYAKI